MGKLMIDIDFIKENNLILLECISGSKAYGLATPESDTDIKGVFILPKDQFYGLDYVSQVSDKKNDVVYFEVGRFVELLIKNNPTIIELIGTVGESIMYKDPLMNLFQKEDYLSKLCKDTFAGYAKSQIGKARGLNKKIVNPVDKQRKTILDFCYVNQQNGSMPLCAFLDKMEWNQENCGLSKISHMRDMYGLYYNEDLDYSGIVKSDDSDDVRLSSIPKSENQIVLLHFNKDGYSVYCKKYKQYWDWVEERNDSRYENTLSHGNNYDSKNMMHTFRLLSMAEEIGMSGQINVFRSDSELLHKIKSGEFDYYELMSMVDQKMERIGESYITSDLPDLPKADKLEKILVQIRNKAYNGLV